MNKIDDIINNFFGKGHKWINVAMKRPVKCKKGAPVFFKFTQGVYGLDADYDDGVNRRRIKEGKVADFVAKPLPWGEWDVYPYSIKHKDKKYLRLTVNHNSKPLVKYLNAEGAEVDVETVKAWAYAEEFKEHENTSQGLDEELKVFVIKEENIQNVWVG